MRRARDIVERAARKIRGYRLDLVFVEDRTVSLSLLDNLRELVNKCDFMLAIFDGENRNVTFELGLAYGLNKPFLAVMATAQQPQVPSSLGGTFWVRLNDFDEAPDTAADSLVPALEAFLRGLEQKATNRSAFTNTRVFVCHRSSDKMTITPIATRLNGLGYNVWYDTWSIRPGDSVPGKISNGIGSSTHFLLFLSQNTKGSKWVTKEFRTALSLALQRGRPRIIPVFLDHEGQRATPILVHDIRGVVYYGRSEEDAFQELVLGLQLKKQARSK